MVTIFNLPYKLDLVIDRTNWKFGIWHNNFLVLCVLVNSKHGVPLLWKSLLKGGSSNTTEQIDLLQKFVEVFGADRIRSVMADREFIGKKWLAFLFDHQIPFYVRMKSDRLVNWGDEDRQIFFFFKHLKIGEKRILYKEIADIPVAIAGTRAKDKELVLVVTNHIHKKAQKILEIYAKRWSVESLFRNTKSRGFNWEDTHLKCLSKLDKLMAVIAVATAICIKIGQLQHRQKPTPYRKTVNSHLYSIFRRGFDFIRRWLAHSLNLTLLFNSSKMLANEGVTKNVG